MNEEKFNNYTADLKQPALVSNIVRFCMMRS